MKIRKFNESYLQDRLSSWDNDIRHLMFEFIEPYKKFIDNKIDIDPNKLTIKITDTIKRSFDKMINKINQVEKTETLISIYNEIKSFFEYYRDILKERILESVESRKKGASYIIRDIFTKIIELFKNTKKRFLSIKKIEGIDSQREYIKKILNLISEKFLTEIKKIDIGKVFNKGETSFKDDAEKDTDYEGGEKIKILYKDKEYDAIVSHNQDNVKDEEIRVIVKSDKFIIPKNIIIDTRTGKAIDIANKVSGLSKDKILKIEDYIKTLK